LRAQARERATLQSPPRRAMPEAADFGPGADRRGIATGDQHNVENERQHGDLLSGRGWRLLLLPRAPMPIEPGADRSRDGDEDDRGDDERPRARTVSLRGCGRSRGDGTGARTLLTGRVDRHLALAGNFWRRIVAGGRMRCARVWRQ